ncbi:hypothetical protein B7494_g4540 [Chlorociboria aeruginascens]|nr:hypothetical protein B7494_g4540 [Chlorociboria aeruginascens]
MTMGYDGMRWDASPFHARPNEGGAPKGTAHGKGGPVGSRTSTACVWVDVAPDHLSASGQDRKVASNVEGVGVSGGTENEAPVHSPRGNPGADGVFLGTGDTYDMVDGRWWVACSLQDGTARRGDTGPRHDLIGAGDLMPLTDDFVSRMSLQWCIYDVLVPSLEVKEDKEEDGAINMNHITHYTTVITLLVASYPALLPLLPQLSQLPQLPDAYTEWGRHGRSGHGRLSIRAGRDEDDDDGDDGDDDDDDDIPNRQQEVHKGSEVEALCLASTPPYRDDGPLVAYLADCAQPPPRPPVDGFRIMVTWAQDQQQQRPQNTQNTQNKSEDEEGDA